MCVREIVCERESVCVRERVCVCVRESVCVCERERERKKRETFDKTTKTFLLHPYLIFPATLSALARFSLRETDRENVSQSIVKELTK